LFAKVDDIDFFAVKGYNLFQRGQIVNNCNNQTFSTTVFVHKFPYKSGETRMQLHQRQKQYAKRLLDFATQKVWGKSLKDVCFETLPDGKPVCRCGYISLSHSANCVAVALSDKPVGVDVQICTNVQTLKIAEKIFTKNELRQLQSGENFFAIWCRKEALWKSMVNQPTSFLQVDTSCRQFTEMQDENFFFAVTDKNAVFVTVEALPLTAYAQ